MKNIFFLIVLLSFQSTHAATECARQQGDVRISATGDVLVHQALFRYAVASPQRFQSLWKAVTPTLQDADLTVGNLEGPTAPGVLPGGRTTRDVGFTYDGRVYSGTKFVFNYHPFLLDDLAESGFDLLTTANNHSLDRGPTGIDRTIEQIGRRSQLEFVGTRERDSKDDFAKIIRVKGLRVGVISCTELTNGIPDPFSQVSRCSGKNDPVKQLILQLKGQVDAIAVFPHWGAEYQLKPGAIQKAAAGRWIRAGATFIVGNHPHVLQTVEWITREDGTKGLAIYSLGNFVSAQGALQKRTSAIAHVDLRRTADGVMISQFSYTPVTRAQAPPTLVYPEAKSAASAYVARQLGAPVCRK